MRASWCVLVVLVALAASGCGGANDASMDPGADCLQCHATAGSGPAPAFSAAGTVFRIDGSGAAAVVVTLSDGNSVQVSTVTNSVGNFYFAEALTPPLRVELDDGAAVKAMARATGACNSCHAEDGSAAWPVLLP